MCITTPARRTAPPTAGRMEPPAIRLLLQMATRSHVIWVHAQSIRATQAIMFMITLVKRTASPIVVRITTNAKSPMQTTLAQTMAIVSLFVRMNIIRTMPAQRV